MLKNVCKYIYCFTFAEGDLFVEGMKIDLQKGITFKIEGELGKYQTLPIDVLVKIAESLQGLVMSIAANDLSSEEAIDLNNFKIELSGFRGGSAMPSFQFTPRVNPMLFGDNQREIVSSKVDELLSMADQGGYENLKEMYPSPSVRNDIVENFYSLISSFGDSPVFIGDGLDKKEFKKAYSIVKFKPATKKSLLTDIQPLSIPIEEKIAVARVKTTSKEGKIRNKIEEVFLSDNYSLSYSTNTINANDRKYILNFPLLCLSTKEDGYYVIENEQLDIIGTGLTQREAEESINEEFDYLYRRLNSLNDEQMGANLLRIKFTINSFVKEVK